MSEFKTKSGADVMIAVAPWQNAKALKQAIEREAAAAGVRIDMQSDISTLVSALLLIDGSPVVDACLWPCLARCTYNGAKITESLLDTAEPRGDYYEIVGACIKENLAPLAESLYFVLPAELKALFPLKRASGNQKPSSETQPGSSPAG